MRPDRLYLDDIIAAADAIAAFVANRNAASFEGDDLVRSAVLFKLIVVGEASAKLSASLRAAHAGIPWPEIISFRNFAVHAYFGLDWSIVWTTATEEVPPLRAQVAALLTTLTE